MIDNIIKKVDYVVLCEVKIGEEWSGFCYSGVWGWYVYICGGSSVIEVFSFCIVCGFI